MTRTEAMRGIVKKVLGSDMFESREIPAWQCGVCLEARRTKEEADQCCTCSGCGEKFVRSVSYDSRCDACDYGANLRSARDACERAETDLRRVHERLRDLIDKPPAGKSRPRLGAPPLVEIPKVLSSSAWDFFCRADTKIAELLDEFGDAEGLVPELWQKLREGLYEAAALVEQGIRDEASKDKKDKKSKKEAT